MTPHNLLDDPERRPPFQQDWTLQPFGKTQF